MQGLPLFGMKGQLFIIYYFGLLLYVKLKGKDPRK